jgi:hypothetical protein
MPAASLRALLTQAIDYAGLFPPASLELEPALRNYAEYVRGAEAWMLGAFILPVAQFDAAARCFSQFETQPRLRFSALGPRLDNAEGFLRSISAAMDSVASFRATGRETVAVDQYEAPLPAQMTGDLFDSIGARAEAQLPTFLEAAPGEAERVIAAIAAKNRDKAGPKLGFKLRTGGVTASAFPSSGEIAVALLAAGNQQVPIKFTAGLHHPIRMFHGSVQTKMHGFLNVLGAGLLALEHHWNEAEIVRMLDDEDPGSFSFTDDGFAWRDWGILTAKIPARRALVTSLGSCSFDEPRDDLRALKLL